MKALKMEPSVKQIGSQLLAHMKPFYAVLESATEKSELEEKVFNSLTKGLELLQAMDPISFSIGTEALFISFI